MRYWPFGRWWHSADPGGQTARHEFPSDLGRYLADSYPRNHSYRVLSTRLSPKRKLAARYRKHIRHYQQPLTSLLDLSCSKGFYVLSAAQQPQCERVLGIDVDDKELQACEAVREHLGRSKARFENLRLHQLAERINQFGGPYQVVLLCNSYQYLFFGSLRSSDRYASHDEIFRLMRSVCAGRVIFNNRIDLKDCQRSTQEVARESGLQDQYNASSIYAAASKYFDVTPRGRVGGYPLWTLDVK